MKSRQPFFEEQHDVVKKSEELNSDIFKNGKSHMRVRQRRIP